VSATLVLKNQDLHYDYDVLLDGAAQGRLSSMDGIAIDIPAGDHVLSFVCGNQEGLPAPQGCKAINISIEDGKVLNLTIMTRHFTIGVYDDNGVLLNGTRGFLCGRLGEGIYIENPIA
jgi:hypothetical protein